MEQQKYSLGEIKKFLDELTSNEVAYYVLDGADSYLMHATKKNLSKRQEELYKIILHACGLEVEGIDDD